MSIETTVSRKAKSAETRLQAAAAAIGAARALADEGKSIGLETLMEGVNQTLIALGDLDADERTALQPLVMAIADEAERLVASLDKASNELRLTMRDSAASRRAANAYAGGAKA